MLRRWRRVFISVRIQLVSSKSSFVVGEFGLKAAVAAAGMLTFPCGYFRRERQRHNDLPWNIRKFLHNRLKDFKFREDLRQVKPWSSSAWSHTDLPRLRAGHVSAQREVLPEEMNRTAQRGLPGCGETNESFCTLTGSMASLVFAVVSGTRTPSRPVLNARVLLLNCPRGGCPVIFRDPTTL
ncbi:hypothetical protein RUM44_003611 [Polyplax serrata]|uniref:Uncharacterized protein n=1 Tax=Polyplax serrata TaxID=468196 RepID=A0ABR1AGW9_POLSC